MFDMGFTELMIIGIVALVVIGPERLPGVARTAGKYLGKLRRFMTNVKADVESELRADELREILSKQQDEIQSLKEVVSEVGKEVDSGVSEMEAEIDRAAEEFQKKSAEEGSSWTDSIKGPGGGDKATETDPKLEAAEKKATKPKVVKKARAKAKPKTVKKTTTVKKSASTSRSKTTRKSPAKTRKALEE
ncbi:MAG: twin-arginine translocase subunit TatB [Gammaproteobacteria bacterium]|nr:twin-arginine translocase subunit TatB [Gammaproteobacteria bacterium]